MATKSSRTSKTPAITIPAKLAGGIDSINISFSNTPAVRIRPLTINKKTYYGVFDSLNYLIINAKGDSRFTALKRPSKTTFKTTKEAFEFVLSYFEYYRNPLPAKDVKDWLKDIKSECSNSDDKYFYEMFADFLLNKHYREAHALWRSQDTFVRGGVPNRLLAELQKGM